MTLDMTVDALALPHMAHGTAVCAVGLLLVREGQGTQFSQVGVVRADETVTVWAVPGDWWQIQTGAGLNGYVFGAHLRPVGWLVP